MKARFFARSLLLLSVLGALACQNDVRPPFIFEIPEGYKGWVSVQFFRGDCPPLAQAEDGKLLARIPASGRLCAGTPAWSRPSSRIRPASNGWSPATARSSVDLPLPLGPRTQTISPAESLVLAAGAA